MKPLRPVSSSAMEGEPLAQPALPRPDQQRREVSWEGISGGMTDLPFDPSSIKRKLRSHLI